MIEPEKGAQDITNNESFKKLNFREIISIAYQTFRDSRSLTLVMLAGIIGHIPLGVGSFDVIWAVEERDFIASEYNSLFGIMFIIGGTIGAVGGGIISDYMYKKYETGPILFLFITGIILIPISISYRFVSPDGLFFYFALFCITISVSIFYGPVFAAMQALTPFKVRSTVFAVWILSVNIIGMGIGNFLTGYLADYVFNDYKEPLTISMSLMVVFSLTSLFCYYYSGKTFSDDVKKASKA